MTCSRFRVEERGGIVAVYDTAHPEYQDTPGCHADYPWTVCSWSGAYDEEARHWNVDQRWLDKAHAACDLLNTLDAERPNKRTAHPSPIEQKGNDMNKWNWQKIDWPYIIVTAIMLVSIAVGVAALFKLAAIGMGLV